MPSSSASASPNVYAIRNAEMAHEKDRLGAMDNENSNIHFNSATTDEGEDTLKGGMRNSGPTASGKTDRKLTIGSRNRSPTGSSPKEKSRKASAGMLLPDCKKIPIPSSR